MNALGRRAVNALALAACAAGLSAIPGWVNLAQAADSPSRPSLFVLVEPVQAHVQQQIVQRIRLQSPDPFEALDVDFGTLADVDGEVIELQVPGVRRFESWGTRGFVYETARAIFPRHSGTLTLPPVSIRGRILKANGTQLAFTTAEPARKLEIAEREPVARDDPWLVATAVVMTESWSKPPSELRTGDITQRTIEVQVSGASGERIPDLVMQISQGTSVLSGAVNRRTDITEDGLIGHLRHSFDVRIDTEAVTDIAPVQLAWWNAKRQRFERSLVRAWRIEPLASDAVARAERLMADAADAQQQARRNLLLLLLAFVATLTLIILLVRRTEKPRRGVMMAWRWSIDRLLGPRIGLPSLEHEIDSTKDDRALGQ